MSANSRIEWTDATWNPIRGCSRVSDGCMNCYAERQAIRHINGIYAGLIQRTSHGPAWTGRIQYVTALLDQPLRWKQPRRIFVNSMSDLFHEDVPFHFIDEVFYSMRSASQHTFQVLTKRPKRMIAWANSTNARHGDILGGWGGKNPLPNVWLGVSVENQATADERIPLLLQTPAAVRFVSYEPALRAIKFGDFLSGNIARHGIDWLIVGGESGPDARACDIAWIRSAVQQGKAAALPVFVKQLGSKPIEQFAPGCDHFLSLKDRKGGDPDEWPEDLRVRGFPREVA